MSVRRAARSACRIGAPAVPAGSPASAARSSGGQPSRQAKQTWEASGKRAAVASTNRLAAASESAAATKAKKREPSSRCDASAAPVATR